MALLSNRHEPIAAATSKECYQILLNTPCRSSFNRIEAAAYALFHKNQCTQR